MYRVIILFNYLPKSIFYWFEVLKGSLMKDVRLCLSNSFYASFRAFYNFWVAECCMPLQCTLLASNSHIFSIGLKWVTIRNRPGRGYLAGEQNTCFQGWEENKSVIKWHHPEEEGCWQGQEARRASANEKRESKTEERHWRVRRTPAILCTGSNTGCCQRNIRVAFDGLQEREARTTQGEHLGN